MIIIDCNDIYILNNIFSFPIANYLISVIIVESSITDLSKSKNVLRIIFKILNKNVKKLLTYDSDCCNILLSSLAKTFYKFVFQGSLKKL